MAETKIVGGRMLPEYYISGGSLWLLDGCNERRKKKK